MASPVSNSPSSGDLPEEVVVRPLQETDGSVVVPDVDGGDPDVSNVTTSNLPEEEDAPTPTLETQSLVVEPAPETEDSQDSQVPISPQAAVVSAPTPETQSPVVEPSVIKNDDHAFKAATSNFLQEDQGPTPTIKTEGSAVELKDEEDNSEVPEPVQEGSGLAPTLESDQPETVPFPKGDNDEAADVTSPVSPQEVAIPEPEEVAIPEPEEVNIPEPAPETEDAVVEQPLGEKDDDFSDEDEESSIGVSPSGFLEKGVGLEPKLRTERPIDGPTAEEDERELPGLLASISGHQEHLVDCRAREWFHHNVVSLCREDAMKVLEIRLRQSLRATTRDKDIKFLAALLGPIPGRRNTQGGYQWYQIVCENKNYTAPLKAKADALLHAWEDRCGNDARARKRYQTLYDDLINSNLHSRVDEEIARLTYGYEAKYGRSALRPEDSNSLFSEAIKYQDDVKVTLYEFLKEFISQWGWIIHPVTPIMKADNPMWPLLREAVTAQVWIDTYRANNRQN